MAALGWLLNLDFAGSGASEAVSLSQGISPRVHYTHRRKRPYGGWMIVLRPVSLIRGLR
jgi:hypothetical protein